eukprot:Sspe_Gene.18211::Locus_6528_Transcript_1_2_Confidence_0.750_Length_1971::g.18211::m.18211
MALDDLIRDTFKDASEGYPSLTRGEWEGLCRAVVESAGGQWTSPAEKVRILGERIREFLVAVPEHNSHCGEDDEDGIDTGSEATRPGCLLPPGFIFDRMKMTSQRVDGKSFEPAPYLDDVVRDWDLIVALSRSGGKPLKRQELADLGVVSAGEHDWWAYVVMATGGFCPAN